MFSRYPNTDRAAPEYLVELINCLAEQPAWIIDRVADRRLGITAKHPTFLPSVNEVLEMIIALQEEAAKQLHAHQRKTEYKALPMGAYRGLKGGPFRPFPKLWEAFVDDAEATERLNSGMTFNALFDASKALAIYGKTEARIKIFARPLASGWTPPLPKVDISDFPDRQAAA